MRKISMTVLVLVLVGLTLYLGVNNYSYIFSKRVVGVVIGMERVNEATAIIGTGRDVPNNQLYSFAIAIRQKGGEIFTASSEDRQWPLAHKGVCAEAKFYPYPPWNLDKSGTYYNARLVRIFDCPSDLKLDEKTNSLPAANGTSPIPEKDTSTK